MCLRSLFSLCLVLASGQAAPPSSCPAVLSYIHEHLPTTGTLKQNPDGFVYVDIDDAYVYSLIELINQSGFEAPPYFGKQDLVGAHISVIYANEWKAPKQIVELGRIVHFDPLGCDIVHPSSWKGVDAVYLITVESKELQSLRDKYKLPPAEFPFHITVAIKRVGKAA